MSPFFTVFLKWERPLQYFFGWCSFFFNTSWRKKPGWLSRLMLLYLLLPAVESKWVKIWNWESELSFWWWIKLNLMDFESLDCNQLHCYQRKHEIRGINFSESATMMSISILAFEIHIWGSLWELGLCCSTLYLKMCFLNVGIRCYLIFLFRCASISST